LNFSNNLSVFVYIANFRSEKTFIELIMPLVNKKAWIPWGKLLKKNWFDNTIHYLEFYYRDHTIYGFTFATKDG